MFICEPPITFPRRWAPNPNVSSPFTARFPKFIPTSKEEKPAAAPATNTQEATHFQNVLLQIGRVLLRFPDAAAAVSDLLVRLRHLPGESADPAHPAVVP